MADDTPATPEHVHAALETLVASLHAHLQAVEARSGENDANVQAAYDALASAGEAYDDALFSAYEEVTPFGPVEGPDDDELDETDDDESDDEADDVAGLDWDPSEE